MAVSWPAFAAGPNPVELAVKATYLYKIPPFVTWPNSTFESASSPFVICVAGADPFGRLLDQAVTGQRIGERPIAIRRLDSVGPMSGCHILYISDSATQSVRQALDAVHGEPILTVTDGPADPGIVGFVVQNNHIGFDIDDAAAADSGLSISSKLLGLAHAVRRRRP